MTSANLSLNVIAHDQHSHQSQTKPAFLDAHEMLNSLQGNQIEYDREIQIVLCTLGDLRDYLNDHFPNDDFDVYVEKIKKLLTSGIKLVELESDKKKMAASFKRCNFRHMPFLLSISYCIEAYWCFKNGMLEAGKDLSVAADAGLEDVYQYPIPKADKDRRTASSGGQGKSRKYSAPAKAEAIRLIKENAPLGGWKRPLDVCRDKKVMTSLSLFIEKNSIPIEPANIETTLRGWLTKDPGVREAFKSCAQRSYSMDD